MHGIIFLYFVYWLDLTEPQAPTTSVHSVGISGVIGRARDLLRTNARSVGSTVSRALCYQPKRRRLEHQYLSKERKPEVKILEVTVIAYVDCEDFADNDGNIREVIPDYSIGKDDVLFTETVDLMTNDKEDTIRSKLVDVFKTRISGLKPNDFSFVKVSRKIVSTPACKDGHKWDYPQIKAIKSQGKLYVRLEKPSQSSPILSLPAQSASSVASNPVSLNVPCELSSSEETESRRSSTSSHQQINLNQPSTSDQQQINLHQPSTSGSQQIELDDSRDIEALQMLFPERTAEYLQGIRGNNITLQETIDEILGKSENIDCGCCTNVYIWSLVKHQFVTTCSYSSL